MKKQEKTQSRTKLLLVAAVFMLALILVAVSIAYFTDRAQTSNETTLNFGRISVEAGTTQIAYSDDVPNLIPGDVVTFTAPIAYTGNRNAYVHIEPTSGVVNYQDANYVAFVANDSTSAKAFVLTDEDDSGFDATFPASWASVGITGWENTYLVDADAEHANDDISIKFEYTFNTAAGNTIWLFPAEEDGTLTGGTSTALLVNGSANTLGITFTASVEVAAIQAENYVEPAEGNAPDWSSETVVANLLSVRYEIGEGAGGGFESKVVASGSSITLAAAPTAPTNYTFNGWSVNGTQYLAGATVNNITADTIVTAVYLYSPA